MDEYEYDEGSDLDNWETEQVFQDNQQDKKDAEEEMPTVAAAWKRHWDDRAAAELAKAEAEATTAPPVVDRADKFLADLLGILDQTRH